MNIKMTKTFLCISLVAAVTLTSGCKSFYKPVFDKAQIPTPPCYPDNKLSSNAIYLDNVSELVDETDYLDSLWLNDNEIIFIIRKDKSSNLSKVLEKKTTHKTWNQEVKHCFCFDVNERSVTKISDSKKIRTFLKLIGNTGLSNWERLEDEKHLKKYCKEIVTFDGRLTHELICDIKYEEKRDSRGKRRLFVTDIDHYLSDSKYGMDITPQVATKIYTPHTSNSGTAYNYAYITPDEDYIVSDARYFDLSLGEYLNDFPIKSKCVEEPNWLMSLTGSEFTPDLPIIDNVLVKPKGDKLALLYYAETDNNKTGYFIEFTDFKSPLRNAK